MSSSCFWHLQGNSKIHYHLTLVQEIIEGYRTFQNCLPSFSENMCQALLGFHSFTGYETTSNFASKGKVRPLSLLNIHKEMVNVFIKLGQNGVLCKSIYSGLVELLKGKKGPIVH